MCTIVGPGPLRDSRAPVICTGLPPVLTASQCVPIEGTLLEPVCCSRSSCQAVDQTAVRLQAGLQSAILLSAVSVSGGLLLTQPRREIVCFNTDKAY